MNNKILTKYNRTFNLINTVLSKDYIIFINIFNFNLLNKLKTLINIKNHVKIIYINNLLKNYKFLSKKQKNNKQFFTHHKNILQGGLYAIICNNLDEMKNILILFSLTPIYKDKIYSKIKNFISKQNKPNSKIMHNFGFITHIKIQTFFFNFNIQFFNFFFNLKNEYNVLNKTFFSRQLVTTTIWLYKSFVMISLKLFFFLINCFFFLIKQLIVCFMYANK